MSPDPEISDRELLAEAGEAGRELGQLLVAARELAATIPTGAHGRRRSGQGQEFWQFRPAEGGDPLRLIDWRRSARSGSLHVRERERQSANTLHLWVDNSASMEFPGFGNRPPKLYRARLLALGLAILVLRGEDRVGILGGASPAGSGGRQVHRLAPELFRQGNNEYGVPPAAGNVMGQTITLFSDFLGPWDEIEFSMRSLARRKARGVAVQLLDPVEIAFPFRGRTLFRSMQGQLEFESMRADSLRTSYQDRLRERQSRLAKLARELGWRFSAQPTDMALPISLMWIFGAVEAP